MKRLTLAVISDIHAGEGARAKDLCPAPAPGVSKRKPTKLDDKYKVKFLDFISINKLKADYLVLPGDVTHSAQPAEVQIASEFIASAAHALGVAHERIVFVPGNHDVDWAVMKIPDPTGLRHEQRYDPIRHRDYHFNPIMEGGSGNLLAAPHFTIWNFADLLVAGYNSSHDDDPEKQHHGIIDPKHIDALRTALKKLPLSLDQMRLFLVHHHPIQYSDPTPDAPDMSLMVNAEQLQDLLREFQFDILVHGHKHLPRLTTQSFNGSPDIAILCSGSFSVQIDTRWTGTINNQFHMITVDGRDPDEHLIQGRVTSWTYYYNRSWEPSERNYGGIPHIEPFGSYIRPRKVQELLRPILTERLKVSDFVEWKWIVAKSPPLTHLRPEIVITVLDALAPEFGCRRHGDTPERIILLKDK